MSYIIEKINSNIWNKQTLNILSAKVNTNLSYQFYKQKSKI